MCDICRFTDCESCTRPISTNPGSIEAGEYGLTRGTCLLACRLELDAVAGLLRISWCVLSGADFCVFFFSDFFFFERTRSGKNRKKKEKSQMLAKAFSIRVAESFRVLIQFLSHHVPSAATSPRALQLEPTLI